MARSMPWSGAGLWTVPAAMLVVFALLLAVPEDSAPTAGTESISVPYVETVVSPEVSHVYSLTSGVEAESVEIRSDYSESLSSDASHNASAITANQDELSVIGFEINDATVGTSLAWHNGDVFYVHRDYTSTHYPRYTSYITMIDASENSTTTWETPLYRLRSASGLVDSSGSYYAMLNYYGDPGTIFRLDPISSSFTTWNEKNLIYIHSSSLSTLFADSSDNLYFASPSGSDPRGDFRGDIITTTTPYVTLSSRTESDSLGTELLIVDINVGDTGNFYGTLKMPDDNYTFSHSGGGVIHYPDTTYSQAGSLGDYTATVQNRLGTTTVTMTLTEEQKITQASSPRHTTQDQFVVLVNKFDPNANQVTAFYRDYSDNLPHMTLKDVGESGTMYFDVFHGTSQYHAYGVAKFDQNSGTITIWPNTPCHNLTEADDKIYCLDAGKLVEVDTSSNTVRQWTDPRHGSNSTAWWINADSTGIVFFVRDGNLVRFVPSTGTFTTFDIDGIDRIQVDSSHTLRAVQYDDYSYHSLTLQ